MNTRHARLAAQWLIEGNLAGLVSTAVLLWRGRAESRRAVGPLNAPSHWVWDREALQQDRVDARHTLLGLAIHQASSLWWAAAFRAWLQRRQRPTPAHVGGAALAVAATAALVDLRLVPERLTPGFEHRLSRRSLALVYLGFAGGLALGALAAPRVLGPQARRLP
jgi:hypothetical protein